MELTIDQALQQGIAAHKGGKLQEAERLYRAILQSQPAHPDANHNLGVLAVSVNKADAALPLFKTALEANPKMEQFWLSYIDALIKTEKFGEAKQVLNDAQRTGLTAVKLKIFEEKLDVKISQSDKIPLQGVANPAHNHRDNLSVAIELREKGEYTEAQDWLRRVISYDPRNPEALSLLSHVLLLDSKEEEAAQALEVAESINPELPIVLQNKARLLLKQSKAAEALEKAQLGYKQSSEDLESLLVLGACLGANQRDKEALPIIEKILNAKSNYAEAYANRALIKLRANDIVGAIEDGEMTVSLKPHLTEMWQLLGNLHRKNNNLCVAIETLRRAHKNEPKNPAVMIQLGEFLLQGNKVNESINIFEKAAEFNPKDANAWANLGIAFQQGKRIANAKIAYEKALVLNPKSAAILINLGAIKKDAEEWNLALYYFKKALEIEPNFSEGYYNLGNTLKEVGRLEEAEASYNRAISLKPDFARAHYNLGNTLQEQGRLDETEASYNRAIAVKFDYAEALYNRSRLLFEKGEYEGSLRDADACILKRARVLPLIALYALGRIDEIYQRLEVQSKVDEVDISLAAFAAYISEVQKKPTKYNFCPNPIDFIYTANLSSHVSEPGAYVAGLIEELNKIDTIWEPVGKTTVGGFQSLVSKNLFESPSEKIAQLKSILITEIEAYHLKFQNEPCSYIQRFPSGNNLHGWTVTLKQQGYQDAHIHRLGWLSGVIYLKVVPSLGKEEGAIEFSLNGQNYHDVNSSKLTFQPEVGDIVFFPSSLHHRTIPFSTNEDRIIVSFDLMPD